MISEELKLKIRLKTGLKAITPRDCAAIAGQISCTTNRYISTSTIKRIFGFARKEFRFSNYTFTTLDLYVKEKNDIYLSANQQTNICISDDPSYLPIRNLEGNMKIGSVITKAWFHPSPLKNNRCLHPEQLVFVAIKMMTEHQDESLPVYEYGKCIGIVYLKDLLYFIEADDPDQSLRYHKLNFDLQSALVMLHRTLGIRREEDL